MKISVSFLFFIVLMCVAGGASIYYNGPVPWDVWATQRVQEYSAEYLQYAELITRTAKTPLVWGAIAIASIMVILASHWRMFGTPLLAWGLAHFADKALRGEIFVPKPDANIVAVAQASVASGLPSTFGLIYGAIFGCVIWSSQYAFRGTLMQLLAWAAIFAGMASRIALGGHWTSQMVASVSAGLLLGMVVTRIMQIMVGKERR